jgi:uncharacterized membrane protein (DUF4010 family)
MLSTTLMDVLIALGLGLLVGLQKERAASPMAGLRTFALVSVLGAVAALVAAESGPWVIVAGVFAVTALMVIGNVVAMSAGEHDPGQTTEVAMVLTFLVGALVVIGPREVAIVVCALTAMLLHLREELRDWVARLNDRDVRAFMQFIVIWLVVLPVLPDRTYGPYDVMNPRQIWLMVVLIVGLNVAGYAAFRIMGARAGTLLAGLLGGVISSTATTMSYARQSKAQEATSRTAAVVVWIASGVVFIRILLEIIAVFAIAALMVWRSATTTDDNPMEPGNPSELKPALIFGVLYAAILFAVAAAEDLLGSTGLFLTAAVAGLTDIDAITLSTSRLVQTDVIGPSTGWRLILVAAMSNIAFKYSLVASLGSREMAKRLGVLFAIAIVVGGGLIAFWG